MENKKRLIDAYKLIIAIQHFRWIGVPHTLKQMFQCLGFIIDEQPTVDAVEVVHGEWTIIEDDYSFLTTLRCSVCGEKYCFEEYDEDLPPQYRYCPNCGAKMDAKSNVLRKDS